MANAAGPLSWPDKITANTLRRDLQASSDHYRISLLLVCIATSEVIPRLAFHKHGSLIVQDQDALEVASDGQRDHIIHNFIQKLASHYYGNSVLMKIIRYTKPERVEPILNVFIGKMADMSKQQQGSRIIEHLIENGCEQQRARILHELFNGLPSLAKHEFGNVVVQNLIAHCSLTHRAIIVEVLLPHALTFAKHPCATHVLECSFECACVAHRVSIVDAFLTHDPTLKTTIRDCRRSHVVRHMATTTHPRRQELLAKIRHTQHELFMSTHARNNLFEPLFGGRFTQI